MIDLSPMDMATRLSCIIIWLAISYMFMRPSYMFTRPSFYALFIHMILENVLPGESKAIDIICALLNLSYPELY